jgi:glycosyltransferase involved in cell wall biosynthesis
MAGRVMKVAVVHDYFTQLGGAERVAEEIYLTLPSPSLFATVALPDCVPPRLRTAQVHTSWMQKLPRISQYYRFYFFVYPLAIGSMDLSAYDLVVSSSSSYAKGVRTNRDSIHVCYCHTPTRWVWNYESYSSRESFGALQRMLLPMLIRGLKHWDEDAARQPDHFVANSGVVAKRIQRAYGRHAEVIYPPIDVSRFKPSKEREDFYLVLSRLISYKRIDLAVRACTERRKRLLVIGDGPDRKRLESIAGPSISFLGRVPDRTVEYCVSRCRALIVPGEEDLGMAPLEAAAAGRPTIAYRAGGATETIVDNITGLFFDRQTPDNLANAMDRLEKQEWSSQALRQHSECFSDAVFRDRFRSFLRRVGATCGAKHAEFTAAPTWAFSRARSL